MSTTTKIQHKGQVTIPTHVREQAGLSQGDLVEFSYERGKIVITPKLLIDRSKFPTADDEYTPAQRRIVDSQLAEGLADIKAGRISGPFDSGDGMITDMKANLKKKATGKKTKRLR
jgi:AbrB family looped-hinge helix DNA binding protein